MALSLRFHALLLLTAVLLATGAGAGAAATPRNPDDVALSWGGQYFSDPSELSDWLAARGATYGVWAERHPGAAELLEWAAAERARRGVPQGVPFKGVPERALGAAPEPEPLLPTTPASGVPLWATLGITGALLAAAFGANAAVRRTGRPGVEPVTLAVSGAGVAAGIALVVFVAAARF